MTPAAIVCAGCGHTFQRSTGRGRPRTYCTDCRPAPKGSRTRSAPPPLPAGRMTAAARKLAEDHVRYARVVAWRQLQAGEQYEDILADALLGLAQAAGRYDPSCGVNFVGWAHLRIVGAIRDGRRRLAAVPRSARKDASVLAETERVMAQRDARWPTSSDVQRQLGWSGHRIALARQAQDSRPFSLDDPRRVDVDGSTTGETLTLLDTLPSDESIDENLNLREALATLDARQLLVLRLHDDWGLTLLEIGELLGVTESRVCQIRTRALKRLREHYTEARAA